MKYLSSYSGKDDPEIWLESYHAAARSEKWTDDQILECFKLLLKRNHCCLEEAVEIFCY